MKKEKSPEMKRKLKMKKKRCDLKDKIKDIWDWYIRQNEYKSQWDGWIEYGDRYAFCGKLYIQVSDKIKEGSYVPDRLKEFVNRHDVYNGTELIMEIVSEYELLAHPHKTSWQKLKEAFAEWRKDFVWRHFKCYFRREMKMDYREHINQLKAEWIGKKVIYGGELHTVVDVDYNGALLIDKKAQYTETTAVSIRQVRLEREGDEE